MATGTGYSAGRVYLQVVPSYRDFMKALRRDAKGALGKAIADTFEKELGEAGYNASEKAGLRAGDGIRDGINKKLKSDAFSNDIRKSIDKALDSLGNTSEETATRLKRLRSEFDSGAKSANEARNELDRMGESLRRVGGNDGNVQVATNARRAAEAILGASESNRRYGEEVKKASGEAERAGKTISRANDDAGRSERRRAQEVARGAEGNNRASRTLFSLRSALTGVSTDSQDGANAFRFFNGALLAAVTLGPALIPVLAGIAGGLALLIPMLAGVGAGLGVAIFGFSGLSGAVKALSDQQTASAKDSAAYQHSVQQAARGVGDAQRSLADAHRQAARSIVNALDSQRAAEERLQDAQKDAKQAQIDLTQARKDAAQELVDLGDKVAQNQLDERQAVIDLFNAYNQAGAVKADGGSTNLEREQSDIALKQAQLNLKRIREEQKNLADDKKKADKTGVEGTSGVQQAEDRLTRALRDQKDARLALGKATKAVDEARADGARSVADAQRNLNQAQEDYNYALQGGVNAVSKVQEAMDKLSPAGQKFARFLFSLKDGLVRLRREAQERFLPGVQDGLEKIIGHYGPGFHGFVLDMSSDLGKIARDTATSFTTKPFTDFFAAFAPASRQFTRDFSETILNLLSGFVSIMTVALPYARDFSTYIAKSSAGFAKWAASSKGQEKIRSFFAYIAKIGPKVGDFFGSFLRFAISLGKALAPIGVSVLSYLTDFFNYLAKVDPGTLTLIAAGVGAIIIALQASSGLVAFVSLLGILSGASLLAPIAALLALGGAFIYLSRSGGQSEKDFKRFTKGLKPLIPIVKDLGKLIKSNLVDVIKNHLGPALRDIGKELTKEFIPAFVRFYPTIRPIIKLLLFLFKTILIGAIEGAKNAIIGLLRILTGVMDLIDDLVHGRWSQIFGDLGTIVKGAAQLILGILELLPTRVLKIFGRMASGVVGTFRKLFTKEAPKVIKSGLQGLLYIFQHPIKLMKAVFTSFKDDVLKTLGKLVEKVPGILKKVAGFFGKKLGNVVIDVTDFVLNKALIGGVNKIAKFVGLGGKDGKVIGEVGLPDKFHTGGVVQGPYSPGRDNRIIRVGGGEGILRPEVTAEIGATGLARINNAAIRGGRGAVRSLLGFAKGGVIWPTRSKHWTTYPGHDGMDFNGPGNGLGDPYFATADGRVAYTGSGRGYGNKVELKTTGGPTVIYGHSSKILTHAGAFVKKGTVLGKIGYSGHVIPAGPGGSHLHFGLKGESADQGAAANRYLHGAIFKGGHFGGILSGLGGLSKAAISIIKNPEKFFKDRATAGFNKVKGLGGDMKSMLGGVPKKLLGGIVSWAKKHAMSLLGLPAKFFKSGLGLAKKGLGKVGHGIDSGLHKIGIGGKGPGLYDNGGILPPGLSMVMNKTRTPEAILTGKQWEALYNAAGQGNVTGDTYNLHGHGADPEKLAAEFVDKIKRAQRRSRRAGRLGTRMSG